MLASTDDEGGRRMAVFLGVFPVLPGKEDEPRKFAQETLDRGEEFAASQRRLGSITQEHWALQQTPEGSMVIVHFDCPDVEAAFVALAQANDEFEVWFKGRVLEITGVDLSVQSEDPLPEVILSWPA
jgi:hypothetical protein